MMRVSVSKVAWIVPEDLMPEWKLLEHRFFCGIRIDMISPRVTVRLGLSLN